jgi:hypothetical protein
VGGVRRRLARIEERHAAARPRKRSAAERRSEWEARQRIRYNEHRPYSVFLARDFIGHRRLLGSLECYSAKSLIDAILGDTELSRVLVEHTVYRAIHDGEAGLEHMASELPDEWADAFRAADEWRARLLSVRTAHVAAWVRAQRTLIKGQGSADQMLALALETMEPYGITEELLERVAGPDRNVHDGEEAHWTVYAPVADILCSSWGWAVLEEVKALDARDA